MCKKEIRGGGGERDPPSPRANNGNRKGDMEEEKDTWREREGETQELGDERGLRTALYSGIWYKVVFHCIVCPRVGNGQRVVLHKCQASWPLSAPYKDPIHWRSPPRLGLLERVVECFCLLQEKIALLPPSLSLSLASADEVPSPSVLPTET